MIQRSGHLVDKACQIKSARFVRDPNECGSGLELGQVGKFHMRPLVCSRLSPSFRTGPLLAHFLIVAGLETTAQLKVRKPQS